MTGSKLIRGLTLQARCLFLGMLLLPALLWAEDERSLQLDNGRDPIQVLTIAELVASIGLRSALINDIQYGEEHEYWGIDLAAVLRAGGFTPGDQLVLECIDGYTIPFDSSILNDTGWQGLIALQDIGAAADSHWQPFLSGGKEISFDPFYVVWEQSREIRSSPYTAEQLPWPWQLSGIRKVQPVDYAGALPDISAPEEVSGGFTLFFGHCIKCHSIGGSGGTLGPALDATGLVAGLHKLDMLQDTILDIKKRFPKSKMPVFSDTMMPAEVDQIAAYLRWMLAVQ